VTKTKRAHWRALESNKNIVANDNSKKPKNRADDGAAGFSNAVACIFIVSQMSGDVIQSASKHTALDRTGVARVRDARGTAPSRSL
jgi:hypothetical protein